MESKDRIVIVDVSYQFRARERRYEAMIKFYIPTEGEYLPDIFIDEDTDFAGRVLTYEWGKRATDREGYLVESLRVYGNDPDEVRQNAKERIEKEITRLRQVVEHNILASVKIPEPEHYEFVI